LVVRESCGWGRSCRDVGENEHDFAPNASEASNQLRRSPNFRNVVTYLGIFKSVKNLRRESGVVVEVGNCLLKKKRDEASAKAQNWM